MQCYDVLAVFIMNNPVGKKKLEKHIPFFFSHCGLGLEPSVLLTHLLAGSFPLASDG